MGLLDFLKETVGIDPGSQHLRITKDNELIFNERAEISIDRTTKALSGLGNLIRLTDNDEIIKPVDYTIADFHGFEFLLRGAIKKSLNSKSVLPKSYIMFFSIPTSSTETEKRAYRDSAEHAGASEVYIVNQSYCSAIGLNILSEQKHFILIDFGHSKIEMTIFANSMPISVGLIRMGTSRIFRLLKNHLKREYKLYVSDKEIDLLLEHLLKSDNQINIQHTVINVREIQNVLDNFFALVNDEFIETIELVSGHTDIGKIISNGIYFTGGGSSIGYLRDQVKLDNRLKRTTSQNPLLDNINGLKKIMTDKDRYKKYIMV